MDWRQEAFRWTVAGGMLGLGHLPGTTRSSQGIAFGVSGDGSVVVGASGGHAFRWTSAAGLIDLGVGTAYGVSDDGSVVVGDSGGEAVRWTSPEGLVALGDPSSTAYAASADGSIIVGRGSKGAFLWDTTHGIRPLRDVLQDQGLDLTGWTLSEARDVSADGLTLVGSGINPDGNPEAWIAVLSPQGSAVLTPETALNAPGGSHTVSVQVRDSSGSPKPGVSVEIRVFEGPNAGASGICTFDPACKTGPDGHVFFTYPSNGALGVDQIAATSNGIESNVVLQFWDADCNENEVPDTCDLSCGGLDASCEAFATCGASLDMDADLVPDDCNAPPDCSRADAEPTELWPPFHWLRPVGVQGVTDEDGDAVAITITSIHQDEPVASLRSGHFGPDAAGVGSETARLRAERELLGDGRVYQVGFTADDGRGGICAGNVSVCVPSNMRPGHACMNQGPLYDSTVFLDQPPPIGCGLGLELVALAPLLARLRASRARSGVG